MKTPGSTASLSPKRRKSKVCAFWGAGLGKTQSIRSGISCILANQAPAADAFVIYSILTGSASLNEEGSFA